MQTPELRASACATDGSPGGFMITTVSLITTVLPRGVPWNGRDQEQ
jgi:hypothetical protein